MSDHALGSLALALLLLVTGANVLGQVFARLRQPKVVGEILAGVLLGPSLLGRFAPGVAHSLFAAGSAPTGQVMGFLYSLGLLLLMFLSGSAVRHVLGRENRRATFLLLGVGASIPFVAVLLLSPFFSLGSIAGSAGNHTSVLLIVAIAASVCSIPFISKIFYDLGIIHTRFASLLLGAAVLEDIVLWGVIAIATTIAAATAASHGHLGTTIAEHIAQNLAYFVAAMTIMPAVLRRLGNARWNTLARTAPMAWMLAVLFGYMALAAHFEVTTAWAAFLAGFGIVGGMQGSERNRYRAPLEALNQVSITVFIPLYFVIVGYKLDFTKSFNPLLVMGFLVGSSVLRLAAVALASRLAGFEGRPILNIALTANARGGPGIVLASIAYDAHIINAAFFTTLVITAIVTSQMCGFWLDYVLRRGWSLLGHADDEVDEVTGPITMGHAAAAEPVH